MSFDGITLFSTDRGAIGERLALAAWEQARSSGDKSRPWTVQVAGEPLLGIGLRGPFNESMGYVVGAYQPAQDPKTPWLVWGLLALSMVLSGLGLAWYVVRRAALYRTGPLSMHGSLAQAQATRIRLGECLDRIDVVEGRE